MKQEVTRQGKGFTVAELRELAELLAAMQKLRWQLLKKLDRRAKAPWIDPLCSAGNAMRYFDKLRSALDNDWFRACPDERSPFYGNDE